MGNKRRGNDKQQAASANNPSVTKAVGEQDSGEQSENSDGDPDAANNNQKPPSLKVKWKKVSLPNKLTVICTAIIAVATVLYCVFAFGQWSTMSEQLTQLKGSSAQTELALRRELRPYITTRTMNLIGEVSEGKKFHGMAEMVNTGRTPATDLQACGDVFITPANKPITDDWACPSPGNPKRAIPGEVSVTDLGSGSVVQVSSPGTTPSIQPVGLDALLASKQFRVYFYGYVNYRDVLTEKDRPIHHTTFCGLYSPELKMWTVCEKHNKID